MSAYDGVAVLNRSGPADRDQVEVVLGAISERNASRLVIGVKRRTPVGKALLGNKRNDVVDVQLPNGKARKLKITKIDVAKA